MHFHKSLSAPPHYKWKIQLREDRSSGKSLFHGIRMVPSLPRNIGHADRHLLRTGVRNKWVSTAAAAGGRRGGNLCFDCRDRGCGWILLRGRSTWLHGSRGGHWWTLLPGLVGRPDRRCRRLGLRHRSPGLRCQRNLGGGRQESVITGVALIAMFASAIRIHAGRGRNLRSAEAATPLIGVWIHR